MQSVNFFFLNIKMWSIIDFVFRHYQNSNQIHKVNNYVHVHVCILKDFTAKSTGNYFDPYQMKKKKTPKETFLLLTWFSYILCWSTDFFLHQSMLKRVSLGNSCINATSLTPPQIPTPRNDDEGSEGVRV